jgi:hypothetical protein
VLARLNQINGVEGSYANEPGSLVRVSLRPDADPGKVAGAVRQVLKTEGGERDPAPPGEEAAPLGERAAAEALRQEQWRDSSQVARQAAEAARETSLNRLLALLLAGAVVLLAVLCWRSRGHRPDKPPRAYFLPALKAARRPA